MLNTDCFPDYSNPLNIIENTPEQYPLCVTEKEALSFLKLILNKNFIYNEQSSSNIIDYEKLIYIEIYFKESNKIQSLIHILKQRIGYNYIFKNKYLFRLNDCKRDLEKIKKTWYNGRISFPEEYDIYPRENSEYDNI